MSQFNVAFAINESYLPHLEIALFSLLYHNQVNEFRIYVLSSDLTESSISSLKKIVRRFGNARIQLVKIEKDLFKDFKVLEHFSTDIYSRYILPSLLPHEDRVLYLDADILIVDNIRNLYQTNLGRNYGAAVKDLGIAKGQFKEYLDRLNLNNQSYFNSGVLLLDLAILRREKVTNQLITKTNQLKNLLRHPDQDIINIVFKGRIKELDRIWNYQDEDRLVDPQLLSSAKIIHYTTGHKPWNTPNAVAGYNQKAHRLYRQYEYEYLRQFSVAKKVSIIIPVYNTLREYIDECIDSVVGQSYQNIEVIIIDDGSNKETANHLDKITKQDSRIKVLHKQNAGSNRARQTGVQASTGEFISFVDADDTVEPDYIYRLYFACLNNRTNLAMCGCWDNVDYVLSPIIPLPEDLVLSGKDEIAYKGVVGFPEVRLHSGVVWGRLYARELIANIDWDLSDYKYTEDEFMIIQILVKVNKLAIVADQLYYYRRQVVSSKESVLRIENTFKGRTIPALQTVSDLYEETVRLLDINKIGYQKSSLLTRYISMVAKFVIQADQGGGLDKLNLIELRRQEKIYLDQILVNKTMSDELKLRAVVLFKSPTHIDMYDRLMRINHLETESLWEEKNHFQYQFDQAEKKIQEFMTVKRSARLLSGNIKRRLRIRTRVMNWLKNRH